MITDPSGTTSSRADHRWRQQIARCAWKTLVVVVSWAMVGSLLARESAEPVGVGSTLPAQDETAGGRGENDGSPAPLPDRGDSEDEAAPPAVPAPEDEGATPAASPADEQKAPQAQPETAQSDEAVAKTKAPEPSPTEGPAEPADTGEVDSAPERAAPEGTTTASTEAAKAEQASQRLGESRLRALEASIAAAATGSGQDTSRQTAAQAQADPTALEILAQISRVELAACRRALAARQVELADARSDRNELKSRLRREPREVRAGSKLVSDARLRVDALGESGLGYESEFESLQQAYAAIEKRIPRYDRLLADARAVAGPSRESPGSQGIDRLGRLRGETLTNLDQCRTTAEQTREVLLESMSVVSENVQLASELALELEAAIRQAGEMSLFRHGPTPLSPPSWQSAGTAVWAAVQSLGSSLAEPADRLALISSQWRASYEAPNAVHPRALVVAGVLLVGLLAISAVRRLALSGAPAAGLPEDRRRRVRGAAGSLSALVVAGVLGALSWGVCRPVFDLWLLTMAAGLGAALLAWHRFLRVAVSPDCEWRLWLPDRDTREAHRIYLAAGWLGAVALLADAALVTPGHANAGATVAMRTALALGFLILALRHMRRVRPAIVRALADSPPRRRVLGQADGYAAASSAVVVVSLLLGYGSLAHVAARGLLWSGIALYVGYYLWRLIGRHAAAKVPPDVDASAAEPDELEIRELREVGWGLFRALTRAIVAAAVCYAAARAWGLSRPHLEYAYTALSRGAVSVQGTQVSLLSLLRAAVLVWLFIYLGRVTQRLIGSSRGLRMRVGEGPRYALAHLWFYAACTVGVLWAMLVAGFQWSVLTVFAGMAGIGLGFGLQDVVRNFVSGLILLVERPIVMGDLIEAGGFKGFVTQIGLRSTTLRAFDNTRHVLPNSALISEKVTNFAATDQRVRCEVDVGVAYSTDVVMAQQVLLSAAQASPEILDDPAPVAMIAGFGDSAVNLRLLAWLSGRDSSAAVSVRSLLASRILEEFRLRGIEIPFPQRDIHVRAREPAGDHREWVDE